MVWVLTWLGLSVSAAASEPAWDALLSTDDWREVSSVKTEAGKVVVSLKRIGGIPCLHGRARTDLPPAELLAVVRDIDAARDYASADLYQSETLKSTPTSLDYYQYLDVPNWTLVADRYWVLRAQIVSASDGPSTLRWSRLVASEAYPEVYRRVMAHNDGAIEPVVNWGEWSFASDAEGTVVDYRVCADIGGSIPKAIQRMVAVSTLPDNIVDLVKETRRRRG